MTEFSDKIVLVTGGAGTLGSTVAREFTAKGAKTIILDIREDMVEKTKTDIGCDGLVCDLTDEVAVQQTVREIVDQYGRIDILANIAGGFTMGGRTHETDLTTVVKMLDFNFRTMYTLSKHVLAQMITQDSGKIVSIGARAGLQGSPQMGPYVGSKAMVIRATETMAREYKDDNININCVLPGTIDTPQNRSDMPDADVSTWVPPIQLANVILFLSSEQAVAINGAAIPVYGKGL